jgi:hypothetical protein
MEIVAHVTVRAYAQALMPSGSVCASVMCQCTWRAIRDAASNVGTWLYRHYKRRNEPVH